MEADKSRMTSASLIAGVQANQEDAWIRMTCLFGPLVHKWINSISQRRLQPHDITDISQDVFMGATEKITTYRHSKEKHGSFRGWLYGITRNKVHQFYRVNSQTPLLTNDFDQFPQWDPELLVDDMEGDGDVWKLKQGHTHEAVEIIRANSKDHTWQAFWRTVVNGEDTADVAEDLDMNAKSVRQSRHRTIQRLVTVIEELNETDNNNSSQ
jgi:RNA polymerase sigma-70 factor (ECF subfamily)